KTPMRGGRGWRAQITILVNIFIMAGRSVAGARALSSASRTCDLQPQTGPILSGMVGGSLKLNYESNPTYWQ
ncbi:MAG: hypothetical protein ACKPKO_63180, partial [Candidatus Fonsibacter sp.]